MKLLNHIATVGSATKKIALIGNPNSGKTTVFNALTGLRYKVGNYPGVTVERREGTLRGRKSMTLLDLPGCYSLVPQSPDERVARDVLLGCLDENGPPDGVLVVVDASNLERNLYLATQVLELNLPTIIVCNMMDIVRRRGVRVDLERLSARLGAPVMGTTASRGEGMEALRAAIDTLVDQPLRRRPWQGSDRLEGATREIRNLLGEYGLCSQAMAEGVAMLLLSPPAANGEDTAPSKWPRAFDERLKTIRRGFSAEGPWSPNTEIVQARYQWLSGVVEEVLEQAGDGQATVSDRIDRLLTHQVWGLLPFLLLMTVMFLAVFWWATPLMDAIDLGISLLGTGVGTVLGEGMLTDLLVNGVLAGVGAVVVFFPQICILFLFITFLEDSGYMGRAAVVMDRIMSAAGLHGKSFIPLLSGFACAIPAIMATRTIANRRDRLTTMLVVPLMSCSARLPVYIILISAIFGERFWLKVIILLCMYGLSLSAALVAATVLKRTLFKGPTPTFILELPPYRVPRPGAMLRAMWDRGKVFLTRAGSVILACSIVLWALAYFPRLPEADSREPGAQLRQSYMGSVGRAIEPVIKPLGFDWRIGVGLAGSFAAREVFVSTMAVVYGVGKDADESSILLREKLATATWPDGRPVYTPLAGISLMVFYVLACQCMSTLAVVRRETGTWRWPAFLFAYMTVLAYVASLVVYQGGRMLNLG